MPGAASYRITEEAEADIVDIGVFTESRWGDDQLRRFLELLQAFFEQLTTSPDMGLRREKAGPNVRASLFLRRYWVYYRKDGEILVILRVIHHSRNQARALRK